MDNALGKFCLKIPFNWLLMSQIKIFCDKICEIWINNHPFIRYIVGYNVLKSLVFKEIVEKCIF